MFVAIDNNDTLGNLFYDVTIKLVEKEPIVSLGMAQ